jgi:hypothetical protein
MITSNGGGKGNECGKLGVLFIHLLFTTKLWLFLGILSFLFSFNDTTFSFIHSFIHFLCLDLVQGCYSFPRGKRKKKIVVYKWINEIRVERHCRICC